MSLSPPAMIITRKIIILFNAVSDSIEIHGKMIGSLLPRLGAPSKSRERPKRRLKDVLDLTLYGTRASELSRSLAFEKRARARATELIETRVQK